ncbi:translocation/assembly module TamB domain-containing protein [Myxococcota bacterium]|nr:translocation/assembly module TamB domain-containing protein [Myxococcota bacterium]
MPQATRRPRRRARWLVLPLLAGVAGLGVLYAVVESAWFADYARQEAMRRLSLLIGDDVHIGSLSIDPGEGLVVMGGLEIHSRDAARVGQRIVAAGRVTLDLSRPGLAGLRPRLVVEEIVVAEPRVRLRVEDGRVIDLAGLQEYLSRPRGASWVKVEVRRVRVMDGAIGARIFPAGLVVDASGLDVDLDLGARDRGTGAVLVRQVEVEGEGFHERLSVTSGRVEFTPEGIRLDGYRVGTSLGEIAVDADIGLKGRPGPDGRRVGPTVRASARALLDLSKLREVLPRDPRARGTVEVAVEAEGAGTLPEISARLALRGLGFGGIEVGDADLRARLADGAVEVTELDAAYGGGRVTGSARIGLAGEVPVDVALALDRVRLERVLNANGVKRVWVMMGVGGSVRGKGRLSGGPRLDLKADLDVRDFRVLSGEWRDPRRRGERPVLALSTANVRSTVLVLSDRVTLPDARIRTSRSDLGAKVDFLFGKPLRLDIQVDGQRFSWADLGGVAGLRFAGDGGVRASIVGPTPNLAIQGQVEFERLGFLDYDLGAVAGRAAWRTGDSLRLTGIEARRGASRYDGDLEVRFGRKGAPTELVARARFDGRAEDIAGIVFPGLEIRGRTSGELSFVGPVRTFDGSGRIDVRDAEFAGEKWTSIELRAEARGGVVTLQEGWLKKEGAGALVRGRIDTRGKVDFHGFTYDLGLGDLDAVARSGLPLSGAVSARARLAGTVSEPRATVEVVLPDPRFRGQDVGDSRARLELRGGTLRAVGSLAGGRITLDELAVETGEGLPYTLAARWDRFALDTFLPAAVREGQRVAWLVGGGVTGRGRLAVAGSHDLSIEIDDMRVIRDETAFANDDLIRLRYRGGALEVLQARLVGTRTDLAVAGTLGPAGTLDLGATGTVDLGLLRLAAPVFDRLDADPVAVDLHVGGTTDSPDASGSARLRNAAIRTVFFPAVLDVERATVTLEDGRVRFDAADGSGPKAEAPVDFVGRLGGGDLAVHRAEIELRGYRPHRYDLEVACRECTVRYPSFLPPATGTARLTLTGTVPDLVLGGTVDVRDMTLRDPIDWQSSALRFQRQRLDYLSPRSGRPLFRFDLRLRTQDGLRLNNNFGTARASADLRVIGDTQRVGIEGGGAAVEGQIRFKGHDFSLYEGTYRFDDPFELNPSFDLTLETRVETPDQDYDVSYLMRGTLDDYQFTALSEPSLSEADINSLLLFGVTGAGVLASDTGVGDTLGTLANQAVGLIGGAFGELLTRTYRGQVDPRLESVLPDQIEVVPVYSTSGQAAATRLVLSKEIVRDRLQGQLGVNVVGQDALSTVNLRADLRIFRGFYLVGTWTFGEESQLFQDLPVQPGNGSLDFRVRVEGG